MGVLVAWVAIGPWVIIAVGLAMCVPRLRWWVQDRVSLDRRRGAIAVGVVAALAGLVVVVPDGWLPIPQSPGLMMTPAYVGRPAAERPVSVGPIGLQPEVDTAWFGLEGCPTLAVDTHERMVALCSDRDGASLHVIDPDSMRKLSTKVLAAPSGESAESSCGDGDFYLDEADRAIAATADRRILAIRTADADGEADLTTDEAWDLTGDVPEDDCLVAVRPDRSGQIWFTTSAGLVGNLNPVSGAVKTLDLGDPITTGLATDETGGTYVVTTHALIRLSSGPGGGPVVDWRSVYDRGSERKSGQPSQGSGTTPTIIDGGVVAITDNAEPRMDVVFYERSSGREICHQPVFEDDASATGSTLASVGEGVIVANNHGYSNAAATLLGRATSPGIARVDVAGGDCELVWTSEEIAPSSGATASVANGLAYAYTKQPTWWGVSAWYFTALDVVTGRTVFSVRSGTGVLMDNDHGAILIAPDGAAWISTVGGLVRVRDRVRD